MVKKFLNSENLKAFRLLDFMKVRNSLGKWLSVKELLDYALEIQSKLEVEISQQTPVKTSIDVSRIDLNEEIDALLDLQDKSLTEALKKS